MGGLLRFLVRCRFERAPSAARPQQELMWATRCGRSGVTKGCRSLNLRQRAWAALPPAIGAGPKLARSDRVRPTPMAGGRAREAHWCKSLQRHAARRGASSIPMRPCLRHQP